MYDKTLSNPLMTNSVCLIAKKAFRNFKPDNKNTLFFFYEFKLGYRAAQGVRNIDLAFGERSSNERNDDRESNLQTNSNIDQGRIS